MLWINKFPAKVSILLILLIFLNCCSSKKSISEQAITLALINGRIWTGNPNQPWAEGIAISGDTIIQVGTSSEITKLTDKNSQVIDARGQLVTPGFIDSHVHFIDGGFRLTSVQLRDAKTPQEFIQRIAFFAKTLPPGAWITGGDWDHTNWSGELPSHTWIDSVTTKNPVWIQRLDGHMALANSLAMEVAQITKSTKEVEGGTIVRNKNGRPTGIFKDNAMSLFDGIVAEPPNELKDQALQKAMEYVQAQGVTSVQSMGTWQDMDVYKRAYQDKRLTTRIYAVVPLSSWEKLGKTVKEQGFGDKFLKIGGLKGFADGSLGSHTAAFMEPFSDAPEDKGLLVTSTQQLYDWVSSADKVGLQVMVHAIGDRAIHQQLDIFERVAKENGKRDRRFRIEHAQHIAPGDIPRFSSLQVIASMQPYHVIDDGRWAEKLIGPERSKTSYAFRSLLDNKAILTFGSDWFVAPPTPLEGIYAAVTRRTLDDKNPEGWIPEQKITVEEALRAYTAHAAYGSFDEKIKGTIEPGKLADFVTLNQDIFKIPPEQIKGVQVALTVVGGKIVYEKNK